MQLTYKSVLLGVVLAYRCATVSTLPVLIDRPSGYNAPNATRVDGVELFTRHGNTDEDTSITPSQSITNLKVPPDGSKAKRCSLPKIKTDFLKGVQDERDLPTATQRNHNPALFKEIEAPGPQEIVTPLAPTSTQKTPEDDKTPTNNPANSQPLKGRK